MQCPRFFLWLDFFSRIFLADVMFSFLSFALSLVLHNPSCICSFILFTAKKEISFFFRCLCCRLQLAMRMRKHNCFCFVMIRQTIYVLFCLAFIIIFFRFLLILLVFNVRCNFMIVHSGCFTVRDHKFRLLLASHFSYILLFYNNNTTTKR